MSEMMDKVKKHPVKTGIGGLSAAAVVWLFANFGSLETQRELIRKVNALEVENAAQSERIQSMKEWLTYLTQTVYQTNPSELSKYE